MSLPAISLPGLAAGRVAIPGPAQGTSSSLTPLLETAYRAAPALTLGLGIMLLVPVLAVGGSLARFLAKRRGAARAETAVVPHCARISAPARAFAPTGVAAWPRECWLEIAAGHGDPDAPPAISPGPAPGAQHRLRLDAPLTRIGREDDNEIRILQPTVHRYHAAMERDGEGNHFVTDLSSADGNGVRVNGRPVKRALLTDGDEVKLGHVVLTFRSKAAGATVLAGLEARRAALEAETA